MNEMSMKFAFQFSFVASLSVLKTTQNRRENKPNVFPRSGIETPSKALRKMSYECVFQVTLQNSTENAMLEHRSVSRASNLRTNAKNDVHYFTYSVFAFNTNEIIKIVMPGLT